MYIDTHTHLFSEAFNEDRNETIKRAIDCGIEKLLLPNIDATTLTSMHTLCEQYPLNCYPMIGLHPGSVGADFKQQLAIIKEDLYTNRKKCVGVGEIGMDLYWDKTFVKEQEYAFIEQINWAKELKLPIVIHAEAFDELFAILDKENDTNLTGVFHCFTGNDEQAHHILSYNGFKLGIGGVLTYKKSELPEVLKNVDLKHLVLETDSPYLPPVPYRGKRNESSYLLHVAEKLAEVYAVPLKIIEEQTTQNAKELFNLQ